MSFLKYIAIISSYITLCACAPMIIEYYEPSASSGTLTGPSGCSRLLGPRTAIEFENNGLVTQVTARDKRINIIITVPDGKSATFLSNEVELSTETNIKPVTLKLTELHYNHYRNIDTKPEYESITINPTDKMTGKTYHLSWLKQTRSHGTSVSVKDTLPEKFYIKLPPIHFENTKIDYPVIKFVKSKGAGIYSANC